MAGGRQRGRVAAVLGGGGVTGAWFELGALRALDTALWPHGSCDFDIFVGVSAGAVVGSHLAAGLAPSEVIASLRSRRSAVVAPFERSHVLRPNWRELVRRAALAPRRVLEVAWVMASGRGEASLQDTLLGLGEVVPAGIFDGRGLEAFLHHNLSSTACRDRFDGLQRELYVVAVDVDTGERVVFGAHDQRHVPISRAVLASCSFPPAFPPCRIEGRDYVDGGVDKNFHLDVAVAAGAQLIFCVNPLLPLFNDPARAAVRLVSGREGRIVDKGMPGVLDQAVRMILHSRMAESIADVRRRFPDVDTVMLEPEPDDYSVFSYNVARFSARATMARHGYLTAARRLLRRAGELDDTLSRHGLHINRDALQRELRRVETRRGGRRHALQVMSRSPGAPRAKA